MARVRLVELEHQAPWAQGEIITIQVKSKGDEEDGETSYLCETLETYPADLKERHAEELAQARRREATEAARAEGARRVTGKDGK